MKREDWKQHRVTIEKEYRGRATVWEYIAYIEHGATLHREQETEVKNQPCLLAFGAAPAVSRTAEGAILLQTIKLFLAPEVIMKPGAKIVVTQDDRTQVYQRSGMPIVLPTHQEIELTLFRGWA